MFFLFFFLTVKWLRVKMVLRRNGIGANNPNFFKNQIWYIFMELSIQMFELSNLRSNSGGVSQPKHPP